MTPPVDPLQEELQRLSAAYAEALPAKVEEVREAWKALSEGTWDLDALAELYRGIHSLKGSGSTFGFPKVTEDARTAERLIAGLLDMEERPSDAQAAAVDAAMDSLAQTALHASDPEP